jgi:hypothetical protein
MEVKHITFATKDMSVSAKLCKDSAMKYGCDVSKVYGPDDIDAEFFCFNRDILSSGRGAGYWLWKPYFIYWEILMMNDGDYLVYTDAGVEFRGHIKHLISHVSQSVFLFGNNYNHEHWCKGNVTNEILGSRSDRPQVQASAMIFRACDESRQFVKRWLLWCQMPGFIDDSQGDDNDPEFMEHRHDQAVITCLAYRYGYRLHYWPAMYNDGEFLYEKKFNDEYPVIFHHHRKRNSEW